MSTNLTKVMRVDKNIASIPLLRVDVPLSSESIELGF